MKDPWIIHRSFWTLSCSPNLIRLGEVQDLAKSLGCTPAQLIFRIAQVNGVIPLAGSKNEEHMKDGVLTEKINLERLAEDLPMQVLKALLFEKI